MSLSKPEEQLALELSCPICLQLYSDPVVLPCGHNYCRSCILMTTDGADKSGKVLPRCPECRLEFMGVDSLQRNFKLSGIIKGYQAAVPLHDARTDAPPRPRRMEVFCDHCIDEPTPAAKTCLRCDVALCSRHLQRHQEKESFKGHPLADPHDDAGTKNCCPVHQRPLEYFCSNDMMSLCSTCFIEGHHQNHDVLTFSVAEEEMRRALECRNKVVSSRLLMTESLLQKTAEEQGTFEAVGDKLISKAVMLVDNMVALVDRYRERLEVLLEEEKGQRRKSWDLGLNQLEQHQLKLLDAQRDASEALSETDTCKFIQRFMLIEQPLRKLVEGNIPSNMPAKIPPFNTRRLQTNLKTRDFRGEMVRLLDSLHVCLDPMDLTFNACTAHHSLILSNDLRTVKYCPVKQPYPEHPERFTSVPQVLCNQGFSSGQHVWVVEVGPGSMWSLGMCYKSIPRRGDHSRLGHNSVSWRLQLKNGKLTVCQSSSNAVLGEASHPPLRIEVALDYERGTLSYHSTKGRREHLHTFRAVFKEPVYPAFSIHSNHPESWITLHNGL